MRRLGLVNYDVTPLRTRDSTLHQQGVLLRKHLNHAQIAHRHARIAHVACRFHPFENPRGPCRSPNRARSAMEHGTVGRATTTEVVPLLNTSEAVTFGYPRHIDIIVYREYIRQNLVADVHFPSVLTQSNFAEKTNRVRPSLPEVPFPRSADVLGRRQLNQPELGRLITFLPGGLPLDYDARPRLQDSHRSHVPVFREDLRHTEFLAENCFHHVRQFSRRGGSVAAPPLQRTTDVFTSCAPSQTP